MLDSPFLQDLTSEQFDLLSPLFESFTFQAKTLIFKQGDQAAYLYIISAGSVLVKYKPYDGPQITLTRLEGGDIFGWSSVVGGETYTADAVSATDVSGYRILGADLMHFCVKFPKIGNRILEKLATAVSPRWVDARKQIQDLLQPILPPEG